MFFLLCYVLIIIVNALLSALSYEYFLADADPKQKISSLIFTKVSILFIAVFNFLFLLFLVQVIVTEFVFSFSIGDLVNDHFPKFMIIFLSYVWTQGAKEGYIFFIELAIYLTIVCSIFEYSILKKKRSEINSKSQIFKAMFLPNILTLIIILGWLVYLYSVSSESFALFK